MSLQKLETYVEICFVKRILNEMMKLVGYMPNNIYFLKCHISIIPLTYNDNIVGHFINRK